MHKVVIIDDEPIIVEGLSKSINWAAAHCMVAGCAYSGEEGLKLIRNVKPDIVFSDIRMPGMDGLAMIAALKSEFPDMQITILTGYRDFNYAQKAISLGVSRFLLKPSKMDEIMEALKTMTERLDADNERRRQEERISHIFEESSMDGGKPEKEEVAESTASSYIIKNAIAYIEEHYQEKLKLSDVAEQVYVSQWHLSKLMNRYQGQNFSEVLNGIRINKAKELLKDPSLRIGDIADEVGFLDMAHFSRVFKKMVGISANEYRNQL